MSFSFNTSRGPDNFEFLHKSGDYLDQAIEIEIFDGKGRLAEYISNE